jgi:hypothetical protein
VQIPARFRRKPPRAEKPVSAPEDVRNGVVGGGSAPETPERFQQQQHLLVRHRLDEEAIIVRQKEHTYYRHCAENPTTLLTRFFGVHRIKPLGSQSKVWPLPCMQSMQTM